MYPFRTVWVPGDYFAPSLEWSAINPEGVKALINDVTTVGSLRAFAVNNGPEPAAVSYVDPPRGTGRPITADMPVTFEVTDGATPISNIKLGLNGVDVTASTQITKSGRVTQVLYTPTPFLPLETNSFVITFNDGTNLYSGTNTFTPIPAATSIPASLALKPQEVDLTKPGFLVKTWQVSPPPSALSPTVPNHLGDSVVVGELLTHGLFGLPNLADLSKFTGPNGSFVETGAINFSSTTNAYLGFAGDSNFLDDGSYARLPVAPNIPGIRTNSALADHGVDDFGLEILTVLELKEGTYQMGLDSDDSVRLSVGNPKEWGTLPIVLGGFSGTRQAYSYGYDGGQSARFAFQITKAGLYPFRLVYEHGTGKADLEWFSITNRIPWFPLEVGKALVGDTANGGIKAYQYPTGSSGSTYLKSLAPGRSSSDRSASVGRAGPDALVRAVLEDGSTPVDLNAISMTINGVPVQPSAAKTAGETVVSYKPVTGFTFGSTNTVSLTFGDRTIQWSFVVGQPATPTFWIEAADFDYDGGQSKPEASRMPYAGGAYAGLGAVAGVDYSGSYDSDSPYYRYPPSLKVPAIIGSDLDRGAGEVVVDFRLGWQAGNWYNYTRTFPSGVYYVYAALWDDAPATLTHVGGSLENSTGGTRTILGVFDSPSPGESGNNALVPLTDAATTNSIQGIRLAGPTTLRVNCRNGGFDFLLFVPAIDWDFGSRFFSLHVNADGTITLEWTLGGTLQFAPTVAGPWADITGAASPFTFMPGAPMRFFRVKG